MQNLSTLYAEVFKSLFPFYTEGQTELQELPELHQAAASGDPIPLDSLDSRQLFKVAGLLGDTAVHVALRRGHTDFALRACAVDPLVLLVHNRRGGTPLHCALAAGRHDFFVQAMALLHAQPKRIESFNEKIGTQPDMPPEKSRLFVVHIRNGLFIANKAWLNRRAVNSRGESLLYLAAEKGWSEAVAALLDAHPLLSQPAGGPNGWNALHAAVLRGHHEIAAKLVADRPKLIRGLDKKGNSPLFYAVRLNQIRMVELLVRNDASTAHMLNKEGIAPAHAAVIFGLLDVFQRLWEHCPDCILLLTSRGSNALHLSVEAGAIDIVIFILETPDLKDLVNERDEDGNTPLHLAAINDDTVIVEALRANVTVDVYSMNYEGLRALDISNTLLTVPLVQVSNGPISSAHSTINTSSDTDITTVAVMGASSDTNVTVQPAMRIPLQRYNQKIAKAMEEVEDDQGLRSILDNMLLVATLIITITFAAGLTLPGGYQSNEPNEGMPVLVRKAAFRAFLVFDALAFCTATWVAFGVIAMGSVNNIVSLRDIIRVQGFYLYLAFTAAAIAFGMGVYVTIVPQCPSLAIFILCMICYSVLGSIISVVL